MFDAHTLAQECRALASEQQMHQMSIVENSTSEVVKEYYSLETNTRECPFCCRNTLNYELYKVAKKNGKQVKVNFLTCSTCKRKFIIVSKAESYHLEECDILKMPIEITDTSRA